MQHGSGSSRNDLNAQERAVSNDNHDYPRQLGGGWYQLSNGTKVQGADKALVAEAEVSGGWPDIRPQPAPQQLRTSPVLRIAPTPTPRIDMPKEQTAKRTKVAIVGFTPHRVEAPYDDQEWEIWALNALYAYPDVTRVTRWFDLHPLDQIPEARIKQYAAMSVPVFLQDKDPRVPTSVKFPKEWVEAELGSKYFTNSIAWMQGLAIAEGFEAIHIYGVDMSQDTEYRYQRSCCEFWLGVAKGRGIESYVPQTSDLLHAINQYGYETDRGLRAKLKERLADFDQRLASMGQAIAQHQAEIAKLNVARHTIEGAKQNANWLLQSWTVPDHTSMEPDHPEPPEDVPRVDQIRVANQPADQAMQAHPVVRIAKEA